MESGPQSEEYSALATSQDMAHSNENPTISKTATELKTAAESSNWTLVDDLLSVDGVSRCDIEQSCLLHKLAAAPEVSLSLVRDILRKILKHKVDINMVDRNKDTALLLAARCDNTKMVMELLSRQAALPPDVTHVCSFLQTLTNNWKPQETPYMHALVVKLLWDRLKDTALHSCHTQLHHTLVRLAVTFHPSLVRQMFVTQQQVNAVDSEGMAVLHRVAMFDTDDHVRVVLFLILKGADVNLQSTTGDTPLHVAVKHKNWKMMEVLLHRRGNSDVIDCEQRSVLHIAASYTNPEEFSKLDEILPLVIRNSNDINRRDREGNTALHLAALAGNMRFMKTLLDHGARADGVNDEQKTVLHMMAISKKNTSSNFKSLMNILLLTVKKDADIQKPDCAGNSALHLAAKYGNWALVEFFLKYVDDASQPDSEGFNILHRFVMRPYSADDQMFFRLTYKVGDFNSKSHNGDSAIHLAAKCQNWDIVKLLVEEGALIDELDNEGFHVLHRMAMGESKENDLLSLVMAKSINFNIRCLAGDTVVHMAARHDNWTMVKCLIEHVENIDEVDSEGFAVIQRLVLSTKKKLTSHYSLFFRLLELGADYTCRDHNSDTVLHLAARNGHWEIVRYLVELGEGTDTPDSEGFIILHRASVGGTLNSSARELFHSLLKYKPDLDKRTKQGDTAIHLAAKHDQWEIVMTLIEHSANVFECDSENTSVLRRMLQNLWYQNALPIFQLTVKVNAIEQQRDFYRELAFEAARNSHWDVIKFLVDEGVGTHHVDSEELSLLHNIAKGKSTQGKNQNLNKLLKVLLDKGMDLEGKCPHGNTPLHLAAKFDNWDLVSYLLLQGASIHCPDNEGVFVLQRLAMYRYYHQSQREILKHLIKAGADLKVRCTNGDSLLHLGAKANNWLFVSHIIQEKINLDLDERDSDGFNILHRLAQDDKGSDWVEAFIMFRLNVDTPCGNGDTCLLLAAKRENWNFVDRLLTQIQKPSCFVFQNFSSKALNPMSPAGSSQDSRVTAKTNVDTRDRRGYTVWHHVVMRKQLGVINELLSCDVKLDNIDDEGLYFLQRIVSDNPKGIVKITALVTVKDQLGNTLLQVAAKNGNLPLVAHFLDYVDDVRSKDSDGLSLLHRVVNIIPDGSSTDHENIVERLLKSGADPKEMSWDSNTPLDLAAKNQRWTIVRLLLKYGARTNICDSEGLSVLHRLACHGQTRTVLIPTPFGPKLLSVSPAPIIKNLIQHGASMKQKDLQGNTPLHLAVRHQSWDVATELVQCGSQVNELDPEGYTVLHILASTKNPSQSFLSLLLEKGARCDIMSDRGETICETLAENENWGMMEILLTHGTLAISEHNGKSLLHRLASSYHKNVQTSVFDLLIEKGLSVDAEDLSGNTPLRLAIRTGNWDLLEDLLQKCANGRQLDGKGLSLLHRFVSDVEREAEKIIEFLYIDTLNAILSTGVDVNARDPHGNTALHIAAKRRLTVIVSCLIRRVDNLNTTDSDGFTLLLRLSQLPSPECLLLCQRLVEKGVDINSISTDGQSALDLAVTSSNWPVGDFLLSKGAQVDVENLEHLHALHSLIKCSCSLLSDDDQLKLIKMLIERGMSTQSQDAGGRTPAELAFAYKRWALFKYLLEYGVQLNPFSRKGNSFFHELARSSSIPLYLSDITRHLIDIGMDINLQNRVGDTPVHVAADKGKWYIVKTFVEQGADTNIPDRKGFCLLHKLAKESTRSYYLEDLKSPKVSRLELLKTLVKHKADVNIRCPENKTALQIAASKDDWETVGGLVEVGAACELTQAEKQLAVKNLHCLSVEDLEDHILQRLVNYITNEASYAKTFFQKNKYDDRTAALQRCVENSKWRMAKALVECGAEVAVKKGDEPLLQIMVSRYLQRDHAPWTSLLDLLLLKGLDLKARLQDGSTVLFHRETIASLMCEVKDAPCLFETLLERGADPLVVNSDGFTLVRKVVDFSQQDTLNALKKLLPTGVTTHQTRLTRATLPSKKACSEKTASPTERVIRGQNLCAFKLLIESGSSSNSELFRLNTEYQVKLAGEADSNDNVRELLEMLNMAASQPRSLKSLCRLAVSHCVTCGPGRTDQIRSLPIPPPLKEFILFSDLLSKEVLSEERVDVKSGSPEDDEYESLDEMYYDDSDDSEDDESLDERCYHDSDDSEDDEVSLM